MRFEWDSNKELQNIEKHGVCFEDARNAFFDKKRVLRYNKKHSTKNEKRYYCYGKTKNGEILTVRFTVRGDVIRIYGAGYWREGRKYYDGEKK